MLEATGEAPQTTSQKILTLSRIQMQKEGMLTTRSGKERTNLGTRPTPRRTRPTTTVGRLNRPKLSCGRGPFSPHPKLLYRSTKRKERKRNTHQNSYLGLGLGPERARRSNLRVFRRPPLVRWLRRRRGGRRARKTELSIVFDLWLLALRLSSSAARIATLSASTVASRSAVWLQGPRS